MKKINIVYACTADYIPYAIVSTLSAKKNLRDDVKFFVHYLFTSPIKSNSIDFYDYLESIDLLMKKNHIDYRFYDVDKYMNIFEGQNEGMWGKEVSLSHYIYFLSPLILKNIDSVIYIDTDIIINSDLVELYEKFENKSCLIGISSPSGQEFMGSNVSNSGLLFLDLKLWRKKQVLTSILEFGKKLKKSDFCDQNLIHNYFQTNYKDKILFFERNWNVFHFNKDFALSEMKGIHYTGLGYKPWDDIKNKGRAGWYPKSRT